VTKIIWIASYPKSGNTWVRFLACNLLFGLVDSAATLNRLAPDLHELKELPDQIGPSLLLKTHFQFTPSLPLIEHTAAAIYIIRDPADVLVSNFHYAQRSGNSAAETAAAFGRYVDGFIDTGGDRRWLAAGMGTWERNVRSWLAAAQGLPLLRLRYEDLLSNAPAVAASLCQFLGVTRTPAEIATAVEGASFERMRLIEESDIRSRRVGIFYKPYLEPSITAGLRFMRAGRKGAAEQVLSSDQWRRLQAAFGAARLEFGYPEPFVGRAA
jgi:aryl sulfotransferase